MDQKRILWIVAAAGAFLLCVFGLAAILYSPAAEPARAIVANAPSNGQASGWVTQPTTGTATNQPSTSIAKNDSAPMEFPPLEPPANTEDPSHEAQALAAGAIAQVSDMTVISQNTTVYGLPQYATSEQGAMTIDLGSTQKATQQSSNVTATNKAGATAIASAQSNVQPAHPTSTPAASSERAAAPAKAATASKPAAPKAAAQPTVTQYWVQAAAFTSKKSADGAIDVLDDNKIPANIFTYEDAKGTLYYRIRVGPYVTKSEAEYWQTKIAKIDTFAKTNSYVTSTASVQ